MRLPENYTQFRFFGPVWKCFLSFFLLVVYLIAYPFSYLLWRGFVTPENSTRSNNSNTFDEASSASGVVKAQSRPAPFDRGSFESTINYPLPESSTKTNGTGVLKIAEIGGQVVALAYGYGWAYNSQNNSWTKGEPFVPCDRDEMSNIAVEVAWDKFFIFRQGRGCGEPNLGSKILQVYGFDSSGKLKELSRREVHSDQSGFSGQVSAARIENNSGSVMLFFLWAAGAGHNVLFGVKGLDGYNRPQLYEYVQPFEGGAALHYKICSGNNVGNQEAPNDDCPYLSGLISFRSASSEFRIVALAGAYVKIYHLNKTDSPYYGTNNIRIGEHHISELDGKEDTMVVASKVRQRSGVSSFVVWGYDADSILNAFTFLRFNIKSYIEPSGSENFQFSGPINDIFDGINTRPYNVLTGVASFEEVEISNDKYWSLLGYSLCSSTSLNSDAQTDVCSGGTNGSRLRVLPSTDVPLPSGVRADTLYYSPTLKALFLANFNPRYLARVKTADGTHKGIWIYRFEESKCKGLSLSSPVSSLFSSPIVATHNGTSASGGVAVIRVVRGGSIVKEYYNFVNSGNYSYNAYINYSDISSFAPGDYTLEVRALAPGQTEGSVSQDCKKSFTLIVISNRCINLTFSNSALTPSQSSITITHTGTSTSPGGQAKIRLVYERPTGGEEEITSSSGSATVIDPIRGGYQHSATFDYNTVANILSSRNITTGSLKVKVWVPGQSVDAPSPCLRNLPIEPYSSPKVTSPNSLVVACVQPNRPNTLRFSIQAEPSNLAGADVASIKVVIAPGLDGNNPLQGNYPFDGSGNVNIDLRNKGYIAASNDSSYTLSPGISVDQPPTVSSQGKIKTLSFVVRFDLSSHFGNPDIFDKIEKLLKSRQFFYAAYVRDNQGKVIALTPNTNYTGTSSVYSWNKSAYDNCEPNLFTSSSGGDVGMPATELVKFSLSSSNGDAGRSFGFSPTTPLLTEYTYEGYTGGNFCVSSAVQNGWCYNRSNTANNLVQSFTSSGSEYTHNDSTLRLSQVVSTVDIVKVKSGTTVEDDLPVNGFRKLIVMCVPQGNSNCVIKIKPVQYIDNISRNNRVVRYSYNPGGSTVVYLNKYGDIELLSDSNSRHRFPVYRGAFLASGRIVVSGSYRSTLVYGLSYSNRGISVYGTTPSVSGTVFRDFDNPVVHFTYDPRYLFVLSNSLNAVENTVPRVIVGL